MFTKIVQMIKIITLLFISSFSFAQSAEELNQQSKELIQQNKFEEALPIVKTAELGNSEAQYNYAFLTRRYWYSKK